MSLSQSLLCRCEYRTIGNCGIFVVHICVISKTLLDKYMYMYMCVCGVIKRYWNKISIIAFERFSGDFIFSSGKQASL